MKQLQKVIFSKSVILEGFAKRVPNAEKMFIDWGRDILTVQFGGIHSNNYSIKEILDNAVRLAKNQGVELVIK